MLRGADIDGRDESDSFDPEVPLAVQVATDPEFDDVGSDAVVPGSGSVSPSVSPLSRRQGACT